MTMDVQAAVEPDTTYAHDRGLEAEHRAHKRKASSLASVDESTSPKKRVASVSIIIPATAIDNTPNTQQRIMLKVPRPMTEIEVARNKFYLKHQDVFRALIPPKSMYFTNLEARMQWHQPFELVPHERVLEQPRLIKNGDMKDYQLEGLSKLVYWHKNGVNGILGDEVGLGKSVQTLSLFAYIRQHESSETKLPHLIICPLSVINHWVTETRKWLPSFKIVQFHGSENERKEFKKRHVKHNFDILVTNYECAKLDNLWLKTRPWDYIVLDEGHRIKNNEAQVATKLQNWNARHRLILSGTAIQNKLLELWSLLHWLHGSIFTDATAEKFDDAFKLNAGKYDITTIEAAHDLLKLVMIRRTKAEVELSVPPKEEVTVFLPLSEMQRRCYLILLQGMDVQLDLSRSAVTNTSRAAVDAAIEASFKQVSGQWRKLQNLLMQLRQLCDHPYMLPNIEPANIKDTIVPSSSKFVFLGKLFDAVLPKGERILIFSQFVNVLELIQEFCQFRGVRCAVLEGQTPRARRSLDIRLFQDEKFFDVYLISTKAGGQGITLTQAKHVVLFDSSWNPQDDLQAIGRAHRIGQTQVVKVYRLICKDSVEDQMLERLQKKLYLSAKLNSSDSSEGSNREEALKKPKDRELLSILFFGSGAVRSQSESDGHTAEDFAKLQASSFEEVVEESRRTMDLRRGQIHHVLGEELDDDALKAIREEESRLLQGVTQVQTRLFEGKMHHRSKDLNFSVETELQRVANADTTPEMDESVAPGRKRKRAETEDGDKHESYCILCRGEYAGKAFMCDYCPRVFHRGCAGISKKQGHALSICPQHRCRECGAKSEAAGGLIYRCRTCAYAACEDCLPPRGEYRIVGNEIPEFEILGHHASASVFYLQCPECVEYLDAHPATQAEWDQEWDIARAKLRSMLDN